VKTEKVKRSMPQTGTYTPKPGEVDRRWHVIDASDIVLGRLASQAATLLRGKHKPQFANHIDVGDFVVVVNAEKVAVAAAKRDEYRYRHSGYPGGLSKRTVGELLDTKPERLIELAVKGMLPKNTIGRAQLKKLKVYAGPEHPHAAQKPQPFEIKQVSQ
jgi:large subunit ribosomal protein L13